MKAKDLLAGDLANKKRLVRDLIRHIGTREEGASNYCVFLGAGASVTSGIKSAGTLVNEWLKEFYERFTEKEPISIDEAKSYFEKNEASWYNPLNPYACLFEKKYEFPLQRRRFVSQEVDGKCPSIGYANLISLVEKNFFNTIFTTNFDDLINEAFYQFSNTRPIYCAQDSSIRSISITSKRPKIIKLHGDYLFEDIKSTIRETESLEQNMRDKLIEFSKEFGLIVVGYAGNDRSIMDVLDFLTKQEACLKNGIYWCLRAEDEVSHQLTNLLWRDKVYPVLIDGFDEFFAKANDVLVGSELDIGGVVGQSRLQKTIKNILNDRSFLVKDEIIGKQISVLRNQNNKNDISMLLTSLTDEDKNSSLGLNDLRNFLEIDNLVRKKELGEAYRICQDYFNSCESEDARPNYVSKLISIAKDKGDKLAALRWSEQLIDLDRYNPDYHLRKSFLIEDLKKREEYLFDISDKFPYNYRVFNELGNTCFKVSRNHSECGADFDAIKKHYESSIKLYPALSNPAWMGKFNILLAQEAHDPNGSASREIEEIITKITSCNPEHLTTLEISVDRIAGRKDFSSAKREVEKLYELEKRSYSSKKESINEILDDLISRLPEFEKNEGFKELMRFFYEDHLKDELIKDAAKLLLSKAVYVIGQRKQLDVAKSYFRQALSAADINGHLLKACNVAEYFDTEMVDEFSEALEKSKPNIAGYTYHSLLAKVQSLKGGHDQAVKNFARAYELGASLSSYLIQASYALIRAECWEAVLRLRVIYAKKAVGAEFEPFIINFNFACKKLRSESFNAIELRNLAAQSKSTGVKICAFSLLDQHVEAKRLIKSEIEIDYVNYLSFSVWPAIPRELLSEVQSEKAVA